MTGKTHFAIGVTAGMAAGLAANDIGMLAAGSLFPDILERITPVRLKHRGISHWGLAYGLLALIVYLGHNQTTPLFTFAQNNSSLLAITPLVITCFLVGCVLHWAADALTPMGVPVTPGFRLRGPIVVGSAAEYAILTLLVIAIVAIWESSHEVSIDRIYSIFGGLPA